MTPAAKLLADEIRRDGPIPFCRFMEVALYHPEHGYYRRAQHPFGKGGDFYTAEQIQPVFGILMAARIRQFYRDMGRPVDFTVALVRALASIFSALVFGLGFFWAGWSRQKQSWHDKIAGTTVVLPLKQQSLV